jgi:hypothetical protein
VNAVQTVLAVLFGAACLYTVLGYPHRYGALTGRSRLFRTVGLSLLVLFLGLVLLYTFLDFEANTASKKIAALRQITYLAACFFLALSLLCIALLDWLEAIVFYRASSGTSSARWRARRWSGSPPGKPGKRRARRKRTAAAVRTRRAAAAGLPEPDDEPRRRG